MGDANHRHTVVYQRGCHSHLHLIQKYDTLIKSRNLERKFVSVRSSSKCLTVEELIHSNASILCGSMLLHEEIHVCSRCSYDRFGV
jgi:hypothetical protein